jgi:hypothetical protein
VIIVRDGLKQPTSKQRNVPWFACQLSPTCNDWYHEWSPNCNFLGDFSPQNPWVLDKNRLSVGNDMNPPVGAWHGSSIWKPTYIYNIIWYYMCIYGYMGVSSNRGSPSHHGWKILKWSNDAWMIWGTPTLGNFPVDLGSFEQLTPTD